MQYVNCKNCKYLLEARNAISILYLEIVHALPGLINRIDFQSTKGSRIFYAGDFSEFLYLMQDFCSCMILRPKYKFYVAIIQRPMSSRPLVYKFLSDICPTSLLTEILVKLRDFLVVRLNRIALFLANHFCHFSTLTMHSENPPSSRYPSLDRSPRNLVISFSSLGLSSKNIG